ncbi:hypothetical protein RMSM_05094 [Rhodopirellula maiorica SM1]|uniref:Uncharacterized protein n=1 Tax=Rhodopirellula maiorica SM1 TaxID=1265738 RepID=M5RRG5_9BACT|nr:hypothetical protein RMSM_05094 [Rhodopirellula maiorica SM1]
MYWVGLSDDVQTRNQPSRHRCALDRETVNIESIVVEDRFGLCGPVSRSEYEYRLTPEHEYEHDFLSGKTFAMCGQLGFRLRTASTAACVTIT